MMFEQIEVKDDIILLENSRVDVENPHGNNWLPGMIREIKDAPEGKTLKISIEGM